MELYISFFAVAISLVSAIVSIAIYFMGISRERKQSTLDAFNVLQEQVFDKINQFTYGEIKEICNEWKAIINDKRRYAELPEEEKIKADEIINKYRLLSGLLARIEHFALGVNTGIYDAKIAERAATAYFVALYRGKLKPLIDTKHMREGGGEYFAEFRKFVEQIEKLES